VVVRIIGSFRGKISVTFAEFKSTLAQNAPPEGLSPPLEALWWAEKGDWARAHVLVNEAEGRDEAWIHAHLHRIEGDLMNARYWYGEAGRALAEGPLETERDEIARALLGGK
jgi:hypothetical protein